MNEKQPCPTCHGVGAVARDDGNPCMLCETCLGSGVAPSPRAGREAAALRENLRRRKAQARARNDSGKPG